MPTEYRTSLPFLRSLFKLHSNDWSYTEIQVRTHPDHSAPTKGRLEVSSGQADHESMTVALHRPEFPNPPFFPPEEATYFVSQEMFELLIFVPASRSWTANWSRLSQKPVKCGK